VAELDIDREEYVAVVRRCWDGWGWGEYLSDQDVERDADEALGLAALFRVGTVLERRLNVVGARLIPGRDLSAPGADAPPALEG
jgi:hypothetical protein